MVSYRFSGAVGAIAPAGTNAGASAGASSPPPHSAGRVSAATANEGTAAVSGPVSRSAYMSSSAAFPTVCESASTASAGSCSHPAPARIASSASDASLRVRALRLCVSFSRF